MRLQNFLPQSSLLDITLQLVFNDLAIKGPNAGRPFAFLQGEREHVISDGPLCDYPAGAETSSVAMD